MFGRSLSPRLAAITFFVLLALCVAAVVAFVWGQQARIVDLSTQNAHQTKIIDNHDATYNDLLAKYTILSGDCKVAADCNTLTPDPGEFSPATPGKSGANGQDGAPGSSGPIGLPGVRGQDGTPGAAGQAGTTGDAGAPGAAGVAGQAGPAGANGTNGIDGKDGADGAPGGPGPIGLPGAPPYSWTYTTSTGAAVTCIRDDPFDPSTPRYHCVREAPAD